MSALRRATESACWALRAYAWPAVWLSLAGALALAVALPVLAGATQLRNVFERIQMPDDIFNHRAFTRLKMLKHLIETSQIDAEFFWR